MDNVREAFSRLFSDKQADFKHSKAGMTSKKTQLLCASLCLVALSLTSWRTPSEKAQTPRKETRTTAGQQSSQIQSGEHLLLADRLEMPPKSTAKTPGGAT